MILLDDEGHSQREIAIRLEKPDSNMDRYLSNLKLKRIICQGEHRISPRDHKKKGDYPEIPYYLHRNLDAFEGILNALIQYEKTKKNHGPRDDSGIMKMQNFNLKSLWSLWRSSYLDSMLKDDKEAVIGCIRKLTAATEFQLEYLLERHKKDFEERISNHLDWLELRGYKV